MKRLDKLILGELVGPWVFGVMIFTVLIMAGTYLYEFTRFLSQGVPVGIVLQLTVYFLPGIVSKTFPMAMLLGTLLAFGRLSGESEIVALRAGGVSILRIMAPVAAAGVLVSLLTYVLTDFVVPEMSLRALSLREQIATNLDQTQSKPVAQPIIEEGVVRGYLVAQNFNLADGTLTDVTVLGYDDQRQIQDILEIARLEFTDVDTWRAIGTTRFYTFTLNDQGVKVPLIAELRQGAWPDTVPEPTMDPKDLLAQNLRDLDAFSSREMLQQIEDMLQDPNANKEQVINLQFGYWNKFSVPLAALVFGLVGAPLGIRNHRAGTATGFWLSVIIIFGYMMVTNAMAIMAQGGALPAYLASFAPIVVGLLVAVELIRRKNVQ